jgi:hypothetical protein
VILGITQGIAEPFPISSLGHGVILPRLAGWEIHQNDKFFLTFLIATHLATAIVLLLFFLRDWVQIVSGIGRSLKQREIRADDKYARLGWLLVAATIPVGVIGVLLQEPLRKLFASPELAADRQRRGPADVRASPPQATAPRRLRRGRGRATGQARLEAGDIGRQLAGLRADPRHLALGIHDGGRADRGPLE